MREEEGGVTTPELLEESESCARTRDVVSGDCSDEGGKAVNQGQQMEFIAYIYIYII